MEISAFVKSEPAMHEASVRTDATSQTLVIPPKPAGPGPVCTSASLAFESLRGSRDGGRV